MATQAAPFESNSAEKGLPRGGIVMYCTRWCPDCRRARLWLTERHLDFVEVDIDANPEAAAQVKAWAGGNRTTPTFDVNGVIIVNFNEQKLKEALKTQFAD